MRRGERATFAARNGAPGERERTFWQGRSIRGGGVRMMHRRGGERVSCSQPVGMPRRNCACRSASRAGVMPTVPGVKNSGSRVNIR